MKGILISWVLESSNPEILAKFYGFAISGDIRSGVNQNHWIVSRDDGINIEIYKPSTKSLKVIGSHNFSPCLKQKHLGDPISLLNKWSVDLITKGATLVDSPKVLPFGVEVWMKDPEGNRFLLYIPNSSES